MIIFYGMVLLGFVDFVIDVSREIASDKCAQGCSSVPVHKEINKILKYQRTTRKLYLTNREDAMF